MVPPTFTGSGGGATAERALFDALQRRLDDDFFVYHQLSYVTGGAEEGEVDFLVVHRQLGLLAVECKGEGVKRGADGRWIRIESGGVQRPLRESPFDQVQRHIKQLVRELGGRLGVVLPGFEGRLPMFHGHALAFPLVRVGAVNLPLDVNRTIVFDAEDLAEIGERVRGAFDFWRGQLGPRTPFDPKQFKRFRKHVLQPRLHLAPSLGAQVDLERQDLVRLTEDQLLVTRGLTVNPRFSVRGGAGTGKTVVALEMVRALAAQGEDVLMLCFNEALAEHLRASSQAWADTPGRVRVAHFHELCLEAFDLLGQPRAIPTTAAGASPSDVARYWNEEAPLKLMEALDAGKMPRWDALIVDEGQDFATDWWSILDDCLRQGDQGRLIVFHDPGQDIFDRQATLPDLGFEFPLCLNFRNPRRIGEALQELSGCDTQPHPRCPDGEPPTVVAQAGAASARSRLSGLVRELVADRGLRPEQITVLTPHSRRNSLLADQTELGGHPLAADPHDRAGAVLHTTIGKFKGLEADVVILADIDPTDPRCDVSARYVAASRARHRLYVFAKGDWMEGGAP